MLRVSRETRPHGVEALAVVYQRTCSHPMSLNERGQNGRKPHVYLVTTKGPVACSMPYNARPMRSLAA